MSDHLIEARWLPAYSVSLPTGQVVEPGGTALITAGEAAASEHWEPVRKSAAKTAPVEES